MSGSVLIAENPKYVPELEPGAHLDADEFMRRYEAMPELKKAELINGKVYMGSPVSAEHHADPDALIQGVLAMYAMSTPGVKHSTNATVRLGSKNVPQPDASLRLLPEYGGATRLDEKKYIVGPVELAVEIAASSASMDANEKLTAYRKAGIREFILWRTQDEKIDWRVLDGAQYRLLQPNPDGSLRSIVFPGLWLDVGAVLTGDGEKLLAKIQEGLQSAEHQKFRARLAGKRRAI